MTWAAIMVAAPFAGVADSGRAAAVIAAIMTECHASCQTALSEREGASEACAQCAICPAPDRSQSIRRSLEAMSDLTFAHEPDASRWTLHRGSDLVSVLDYRDNGTVVAMTRAFTVPPFRGNGYAAEVVSRAVAELEERGDRQVLPVCWYVAEWFERNPQHGDILAARTA